MSDFEMEESGSEYDDMSDAELQDAFERGELKPGLNVVFNEKRDRVNDTTKLLAKTKAIQMSLPWVERLDMVNTLAPMAPELAVQLEKHEQKRANVFKGNAKLPYVRPEEDPVLNDFKREMLFHRQAQSAVLEGIPMLQQLGIKTRRPDDYFAEMAKSDEHMQKVRSNLMAKQQGQAKSERIKQIREQRKMGKMLAKQTKVQREAEKKDMLDKLKKFRKGKLKNLDFLEDAKALESKQKKTAENRKARNKKFGFGGKKKGLKRNTKSSSAGLDAEKSTRRQRGAKAGASVNKRMGKSRRIKAKGRK
ncbi:probable rRNA-processing protein EBP2 homolog [Drosophila madeirensis]|uniref:Blast:Probable rRNA-processing protein EBP2 homolog n=3 Tax=obscura subgroup TaxID=32357 RepID=A0A3B0JEQ9_DROGU|nr:probable rRNA-processing protein EBP2 homolog [Drosophila guanche]XP_034660128.1 probable rRNA-processing protein EBP2 homolog [Drosophila subobscura]SPP80817.1 blast:Probable rRNA-processing protein EBP2 homolog [Drosophila guanche]